MPPPRTAARLGKCADAHLPHTAGGARARASPLVSSPRRPPLWWSTQALFPSTREDLGNFISLVLHYRHHVPCLPDLLKPLKDLQEVPDVDWTSSPVFNEAKGAFDLITDAIARGRDAPDASPTAHEAGHTLPLYVATADAGSSTPQPTQPQGPTGAVRPRKTKSADQEGPALVLRP